MPIRERLAEEVGPIARHVLVVLLLEASLLVIGLATQWLERVLPGQKEHLALVEKLDAWTALTLLGLFASYTVSLVGIRLWRSLSKEVGTNAKPITEASRNE